MATVFLSIIILVLIWGSISGLMENKKNKVGFDQDGLPSYHFALVHWLP